MYIFMTVNVIIEYISEITLSQHKCNIALIYGLI